MFVDFLSRSPEENMAIDEAILRSTHEPILRFYNWATPCVSLGYFQSFQEISARFPNQILVRRWTGGGAVEHGSDLTFSLIVPRGHALAQLRPSESYLRIHQILIKAMQLPAAKLVCEPNALSGESCFESPVAGDILLDGKKICGGAQRRSRYGLLHQGSLLTHAINMMNLALHQRFAELLGWDAKPCAIPSHIVTMAKGIALKHYAQERWLKAR